MPFTERGRIATLAILSTLTQQCLKGFSYNSIARAGLHVCDQVENFKRRMPKKVTTSGGGISDASGAAVDNFKLAEFLFPDYERFSDQKPATAKVTPKLLSYIATICTGSEIPSQDWIDSALFYVAVEVAAVNDVETDWNARLAQEVRSLEPLASTGKKFVSGRKSNSDGPLTKAVAAHLKRNVDHNPEQVWTALAKKPPKGMTFVDSPKLGRYIEYDKRTHKGELKDTGFRRFANVVYRKRKQAQQLH